LLLLLLLSSLLLLLLKCFTPIQMVTQSKSAAYLDCFCIIFITVFLWVSAVAICLHLAAHIVSREVSTERYFISDTHMSKSIF